MLKIKNYREHPGFFPVYIWKLTPTVAWNLWKLKRKLTSEQYNNFWSIFKYIVYKLPNYQTFIVQQIPLLFP
jgi:hypothetical protein